MQIVDAAGTDATPAAFYLGLCRLRGILSPPAPSRLRQAGHSSLSRRLRQAVYSSLPLRPLQAEPFSAALIPKIDPEIKNRCTQKDVSGVNLASISKSGLEIKNRCTQEGQSRAFLAAIPDFSPRISNHCSARSLSLDIPADKWSEAWCRGRGMPDG